MAERIDGMRRSTIHQLYELHGPYLFKRCKRFLGDEEEAYDALQEVFVRLLKRSDLLEEQETLLPWLNRVTTNYCLNVIRYRSYRQMDDSVTLEHIPGNEVEMFELLLQRRDMVEKLFAWTKEPLREVAACYFLDELTLAETAKQLSMSVATVRRRLKAFVEAARRELPVLLGES